MVMYFFFDDKDEVRVVDVDFGVVAQIRNEHGLYGSQCECLITGLDYFTSPMVAPS